MTHIPFSKRSGFRTLRLSGLMALLLVLSSFSVKAQFDSTEVAVIKQLYTAALSSQQGYKWLKELTDAGPRLTGSPQATEAVKRFALIAEKHGFKTRLQRVKVPVWTRGEQETAYFMAGLENTPMNICALGGSIATPENGLEAEVVEITNFNQLDLLDLKGKIAFFNIPMNPAFISTFSAYGGAVKQRWAGAIEASKRGAIGVICRSLSSSINPYPHTGSMTYRGAEVKIPSAAISTLDAENLSAALKAEKVKVNFKMQCAWQDSAYSYNLIAELPGTEKPEEIIVIGGHIDSWDLGTGAHDDGAGCMHALEAAYLLKQQNLLPKRTLRVVFFMNEEFGLSGAREYAEQAEKANEKHVLAIESDAGGFSPRGISISAEDETLEQIKNLRELLEPYGIHQFGKGGGGADINQIKGENVVKIGLRPDSQRYFEIHHSALDVLDQVNAREMELGSGTLAAVIYILDKYDWVGY
jgi:hypothetical protein